MLFNYIIVLIDHFIDCMQMIGAHLDIPGTISWISEFLQNAFYFPVPI